MTHRDRLAVILLFLFATTAHAQDIGHAVAEDLRSGKIAEAQKLLADALKKSPNDARLWTLNGVAQVRAGQNADAISSFRRALQITPGYIPALESAARLEYETRDPHAEADLELLLQKQPTNENARTMLTTLYFVHRKYDRVIATLSPQVEHLDAPNLDILGESYYATGRPDIAVKVLARAIVLDPSSPDRYVYFADACLLTKQFTEALQTLNSGIAAHPNAAQLYVARGIVNAELAHYGQSDADFQEAETLDPTTAQAAGAKGLTALQKNDLTLAEAEVRQQLRDHPNDAMLHYVLAETIVKSGATPGSERFNEALQSAESAVKEQPNLALAHDILGRLYLESGRNADAVCESKQAMALNPQDPTAIYHLILALRKSAQTEEIPALLKKLASMHAQK